MDIMVGCMDLDRFREESLSILKLWKDNNNKKVKEYLSNHKWLKADELKLEKWKKENKIVLLAITDKFIYGIDNMQTIYSVGRGTLGIADNFK